MLKLIRFLKGYRFKTIFGPIFKLIEAVCELITPFVVAWIIDTAIPRGQNGDYSGLIYGGTIILALAAAGRINPAIMISHVGGLDSVIPTVMNLPNIKGAKKLVYTNISMPMTAIEDFAKLGETDPFFKDLAEICERHNGIWSEEAEKYLLKNAKPI